MSPRAVVIGAGFAGLAASAYLARDGWDVTVLEKNDGIGGRARFWKEGGFTFDMGPSWYLMPEVFERFFADFGRKREDHYALTRLDPSYRVYFEGQGAVDVPSDPIAQRRLFESLEPCGAGKLERYLRESALKYRTAVDAFLYRDFAGGRDLLDRRLMAEGRRLHLLRSLDAHVRRAFKDPRARKILEYPVVFLGASPRGAPALYSLLSHADLNLGVWYPAGGLGAVAESLARLAEGLGVRIRAGSEATGVASSRGRATAVRMGDLEIPADAVLATGDYHWMETRVLRSAQRTYGEAWWDRRTTAPSMLVAYLGLDGPLAGAAHHTLYFSRDWNRHFRAVFDRPRWPGDPCWYLGRTTATDPSMAPPGKENLFLLVPLAPGLEDSDATREAFFDRLARRIREETGIDLLAGLAVKRLYGPSDFAADYRAWRGTALGLAHTLRQTAVFRPARRSRKLENLYYAGQYTHPGVGVPMALIAARLAAEAMGAGR